MSSLSGTPDQYGAGLPHMEGAPVSVKEGPNADARRVLIIVAASTVPGSLPAAPTGKSHYHVGFPMRGKRWLHLYGKVTGTAPSVTVQIYFWSFIANDWVLGPTSTFDASTQRDVIEMDGETHVAFVATSRANANNTLDLWGGVNGDVYDLG